MQDCLVIASNVLYALMIFFLIGCGGPAHPEWGTIAIYRDGQLADCWADGVYFPPTNGRCDLGGSAVERH